MTQIEKLPIEKFDADSRAVHHHVTSCAADRDEAVAIACMVLAQLLRAGVEPAERERLLVDANRTIREIWVLCDEAALERW